MIDGEFHLATLDGAARIPFDVAYRSGGHISGTNRVRGGVTA